MKKQTSIFLVILLCILVAVAAGSTSYLVLANAHDQETQSLNDQIDRLETQIAKLQKEAKKVAVTPTPTPTTTATATTTDETATWNSATISQLNTTFKFPKEWGTATIVPSHGMETGESYPITFSELQKNISTPGNVRESISMGYATLDTVAERGSAAWEIRSTDIKNLTDCATYQKNKPLTDGRYLSCADVTKNNKTIGIVVEMSFPDGGMYGSHYIQAYYFTGNTKFPVFGIGDEEATTATTTFVNLIKSFTPSN